LLIHNEEYFDVNILIKPVKYRIDEDFVGGFDDDYKGIKIIWGGGQESGVSTTIKGISTKIQENENKKYAFLFVFPTSNLKLLEYNLTLKIEKTIKEGNERYSTEEIRIKLHPIQNIEFLDSIVHQKIIGDSLSNKITFAGNLVGYYYPRWYPELENFFPDNENYYQSDSRIADFYLSIFRRSSVFGKDRIILYFRRKEIAKIEGELDGASFHIDVFKFNDAFIIRIWFLWISNKQFKDRNNLEPLAETEKRFFDFEPELPDFERFDIVVSPTDGNILTICTDFHWQEYWYKIRKDDPNIIGIIAKLLHPVDESLSQFLNLDYVDNKYDNIIDNLRKMTSMTDISEVKKNSNYIKGQEIDQIIQYRKNLLVTKGKNFFRGHVPFVRNADILPNMISPIVDRYE